ncbi:MAG: glycerate kinase [bacterium]
MPMREDIISLFQDALQAVLPENLIKSSVKYQNGDLLIGKNTYHLHDYRRIYLFGSGKASGEMVRALHEVIDYPVAGGFVVSNHAGYCAENIEVFESSHPVPRGKSLIAADMLIEHLERLSSGDFFIYALSGGSSALLEKPLPPLTLADLQKVTRILLESNVPIEDVNRVRKHVSMVKGGRLGQFTRAQGVILVISDVIGDDLETIGSAPFYGDSSSYNDVYDLLTRSGILTSLPENAQLVIDKGLKGEIEDTPKRPAQVIEHFIIGSNLQLLMRAKEKAQAQGMKAVIMTSQLKGEAREVARVLISLGKEIVKSGNPFERPVCLLFGGETTVTVKGRGTGGRNQELCLSALQEIRDEQNIFLLSAGTDGIDGNSDAAGAIVDSRSYLKAQDLGLRIDEYLKNNDSYNFFKQTKDLIKTGPTGTNVMDLTIMVIT